MLFWFVEICDTRISPNIHNVCFYQLHLPYLYLFTCPTIIFIEQKTGICCCKSIINYLFARHTSEPTIFASWQTVARLLDSQPLLIAHKSSPWFDCVRFTSLAQRHGYWWRRPKRLDDSDTNQNNGQEKDRCTEDYLFLIHAFGNTMIFIGETNWCPPKYRRRTEGYQDISR